MRLGKTRWRNAEWGKRDGEDEMGKGEIGEKTRNGVKTKQEKMKQGKYETEKGE